jgi:hypothetical protein
MCFLNIEKINSIIRVPYIKVMIMPIIHFSMDYGTLGREAVPHQNAPKLDEIQPTL